METSSGRFLFFYNNKKATKMQWYVIAVLRSLMKTDCTTNQSARYMIKIA